MCTVEIKSYCNSVVDFSYKYNCNSDIKCKSEEEIEIRKLPSIRPFIEHLLLSDFLSISLLYQ